MDIMDELFKEKEILEGIIHIIQEKCSHPASRVDTKSLEFRLYRSVKYTCNVCWKVWED